MIAWAFLLLLLVFPWVAPRVERACSKHAGYDQPTNDVGEAGQITTSGHLQ